MVACTSTISDLRLWRQNFNSLRVRMTPCTYAYHTCKHRCVYVYACFVIVNQPLLFLLLLLIVILLLTLLLLSMLLLLKVLAFTFIVTVTVRFNEQFINFGILNYTKSRACFIFFAVFLVNID